MDLACVLGLGKERLGQAEGHTLSQTWPSLYWPCPLNSDDHSNHQGWCSNNGLDGLEFQLFWESDLSLWSESSLEAFVPWTDTASRGLSLLVCLARFGSLCGQAAGIHWHVAILLLP